jgi:hypothetical protein
LTFRFSSVAQNIRLCCSALIGRYLKLPVIRFVAISFIIGGLLILTVACWTSKGGLNIFGSWAGGDYACFYVAGTILNEHSPDQLYDFHLQNRILHALFPRIPATAGLPFINPPFFALLFRPFALLPFTPSFLAWISASIILYVLGFSLIRKTLRSIPEDVSTVSLLLALSFEPFLMECAIGGNTSAVAFFAIALALYFDRKGFFIWSGMALGLCLYKPTFLLLVLPMLVLARRIKMLLGFFTISILLAGISCLVLGKQSCLDYLHIFGGVSHMSLGTESVFRTFKYVDILSFYRLLPEGYSPLIWASALAVVFVSFYYLIPLWWKLDQLDDGSKDLIWACTLTLTTVLNLHFAIYDSVIVVPAILLSANVLYRRSSRTGAALTPVFQSLIVLLYLTPWLTQQMAQFTGLQIFTLVLAATGAYQIFLARRRTINVEINKLNNGNDVGSQPEV